MVSSTYKDTFILRQAIIDACLEMNTSGINQGTSGNISVRIGSEMLITPSGIPYEKMTPEMIVALPLSAENALKTTVKPSSEWRFHRDILRAKPDVQAVVHAHPIYATALAMNRQEIPACHYMIAAFGGDTVPVADYALFGTDALSGTVTKALANRSGCLMANHGAVVVGDTLDSALWRMVELETLAKGYATSLSIGAPHILSESEIKETLAAFKEYGLRTAF